MNDLSERCMTASILGLSCSLLLLLAYGCVPAPRPDNPDAGTATCKTMCARITELGCPGAEGSWGADDDAGTDDDVACAPACQDLVEGGANLELACVTGAETCEDVDRCFEGGE